MLLPSSVCEAEARVKKALSVLPFIDFVQRPDDADRIIAKGRLSRCSAILTLQDGTAEEEAGSDWSQVVECLRPHLIKGYVLKSLSQLHPTDPALTSAVEIITGGEQAIRVKTNGIGAPLYVIKIGTAVTFRIHVKEDCYATVLDISVGGNLTVLFPNSYQKESRLEGGKWHLIPASDAPFEIVAEKPAGRSVVIAVTSRKPLGLSRLGLPSVFDESTFTTMELIGTGGVITAGRGIRDILPESGYSFATVVADVVE